MTDDVVMRQELQRVAAYRELCATVRRGGRHNALFAALMLFLAVSVVQNGAVASGYIFGALALAELIIGLWKWLSPSAEGVLLDGVVLIAFGGWNVVRTALVVQAGGQPQTFSVILGLFLIWGAVGRFRAYSHLRRLFAERPTRDQLAWFDGLVAEIRQSDPETDATALDLRRPLAGRRSYSATPPSSSRRRASRRSWPGRGTSTWCSAASVAGGVCPSR
ncbi:MAG: hypothetical protein U0804_27470 [Gemmataceae bacterium]